ncbi:hypothetical protein BD309DRAFT_959455 [Dichomitus squalens]|uniref:Uncharacterized protein n=2 Tax=Dichomitus squalens TaxID=114155 RepID=A0A4Q9QBS5_9APHY|nr:uncharacterized protein DICSQDRAFT_141795 [Dichomitus squalens LYAD-421 SS1]EJF55765.1 hypothetical protein DICSQDRAFT_141795 [Dichomitus squalens LYAD-421 SS1]TBU43966.1 hypothetical protein BD309DRAFT_959455 [Dichomitus squalens]TBU65163.1 hypothetical protein BD310DRAFT_914180 [Dichomitus squalens]
MSGSSIPKAIGQGYLKVISAFIAGASKINRGLGTAAAIICCPCTCGTSLIIAADE